MAKLLCICGNALSNVDSPNEIEGVLLRGVDIDSDKDLSDVLDLGRDVWECDSCGRLAVSYPGPNDTTVKWYKPEDDAPGKLFAFDKFK